MPESGYIIENYTRVNKDADAPMNRLIKSVVQPLQVKYCPNPHYFRFKRFQKTANENGLAVKNPFGQANTTRLIRINHYYSKSKEEYLTKIKVRKYSWKDESQQRTYNESDWAFPEWRLDDSMKEAAAALRARGVPETHGGAGDAWGCRLLASGLWLAALGKPCWGYQGGAGGNRAGASPACLAIRKLAVTSL